MKKIVIISFALLLVLALTLPASAQGRGRHHEFGKGPAHGAMDGKGHLTGLWKDPRVVEGLKLTDDQVTALRETDFAFRERIIQLHSKLKTGQLELEKLMSRTPLKEDAAKKQAKKISDLHGQMFLLRFDHELAVRNVLSADQVSALQKLQPQYADKKKAKRLRREKRSESRNETSTP